MKRDNAQKFVAMATCSCEMTTMTLTELNVRCTDREENEQYTIPETDLWQSITYFITSAINITHNLKII
jgi:hypothetical protein